MKTNIILFNKTASKRHLILDKSLKEQLSDHQSHTKNNGEDSSESLKAKSNLLMVNLDRLDHRTRDIVLESYDDTCVFPTFQPKRSKKKSK